MMDALWETNPDTYVILEHLVENGREWRELAAHRGGAEARPGPLLWHNMERPYSQGALGYPTATDFPSALTETYSPNWAGGIPVPNAVTYMESHDEQWLMYRNRQDYANASGGYDISDLGTALDRQELVGAFFFTVPGPRMIWQFGELGYGGGPGECLVNGDYPGECSPGVPGRVAPKPIRWDYWTAAAPPFANGANVSLTKASDEERADRRDLYGTWSALLALRNGNDLFTSPETDVETQLGLRPDRWITLSLDGAPEGQPTEAAVFGNFGVTERTVTVPLDEAATWYDYFDGTEAALPAGDYTATLAPGEYRVWTNARVEGGGPVSVDDVIVDPIPEGLQSVFPNPAAGRATVRFALGAPRAVRVDLFDALGRRVRTLADGPYPAGASEVAFETASLPAGVYVVRFDGHARTVTVAR